MKLIIHELVLFPRRQELTPRRIQFAPGMVNVITGTSARGKTAVGHIIDYCLGSGKSSIPVGVVRDAVAWYGLSVETTSGWMFIARRESGEQQSTDDYCVLDGPEPQVPSFPERNSTRSVFKARMDELSGLPGLPVDPAATGDQTRGRASFRDMAAFNFLPQHIVANPQTLFAKTDTTEHREKLRRVFPLALGAIDNDYLLAQQEEGDLRKRLQRLMAEYSRRRAAIDTWRAELRGLFLRAKELGVIGSDVLPPDPTEQLVALLRRVVSEPDRYEGAAPAAGNTEAALRELARLESIERATAQQLADSRRHLRRIETLSVSARHYGSQLLEEELRVVGVGWFRKHLSTNECPFCGSESDKALAEVNALAAAGIELEALARSIAEAPVRFDAEEARLRVQIRAAEDELQSLRRQRAELEEHSREVALARQQMSEVYRFVGRLEQAIANTEATDDGEDSLRGQIDWVNERLAELALVVDPTAMRRRLEIALEQVSRLVTPAAATMSLERSGDLARLVISELTIAFEGPTGRKDYLWEIGSGENWMGYHIAALLALHQFFQTLPANPVPSFLVIDQPSQVYFPAVGDAYDRARQRTSATHPTGDFARARRIFEALSEGIEKLGDDFQIIVTEHADQLTWGDIPRVRLVENWRGDDYLIPHAWLT